MPKGKDHLGLGETLRLYRTIDGCCEPAPDGSGRVCNKPKGHDGPHWAVNDEDLLTWTKKETK